MRFQIHFLFVYKNYRGMHMSNYLITLFQEEILFISGQAIIQIRRMMQCILCRPTMSIFFLTLWPAGAPQRPKGSESEDMNEDAFHQEQSDLSQSMFFN